jgi:hypothetical protein
VLVLGLLGADVGLRVVDSTRWNSQEQPEHQQDNAESSAKDDHKDTKETLWRAGSYDPITVFTAGLVLVASIQAGLFVWQLLYMRGGMADAKDTAQAAKLTAETLRKQFIATHRPRMAVRGLFMFLHGDACEIRFLIHNNGETEGKIVDYQFYMRFSEKSFHHMPMIQASAPQPPVLIKPGDEVIWMGTTKYFETKNLAALMSDEFNGRDSPEETLQLRGRVFYEDISGNRRQSSFHRAYDFKAKRFRRIDDSEFEYD